MANSGQQTGRSLRGGIGKYQTKSNQTRWRYALRHDGHLYQKGGFQRETDAKRARDRLRADLSGGTHIHETRETFLSYAQEWIDTDPKIRESTRTLYRDTLSRDLKEFHDRPLPAIKPEEVRRWYAALRKRSANTQTGTLSDASVARSYSLLRRVLNGGVREGKIHRNPCTLETRAPRRIRETPLLEHTEVLRLAETVAENYRALVLVAAFGGLRWSEAIALRPIDVDLDAGTVSVRRTYVEQMDGVIQATEATKSEAGRRTVQVLSPIATQALTAHINALEPDPSHLLFSCGTGTALRRPNFYRRVWNPALKEADLTAHRYTFHHLRHYGLTLLGQSGATLQELMDWGGHSSVKSVMVYQHTDRDHLDRVVENAAARIVEATGAVPFRKRDAV